MLKFPYYVHPIVIVSALFIVIVISAALYNPVTEDDRPINDVGILKSGGDFWFSDDTAYFVKSGSISPLELKALHELSYEKEVVVVCDMK